MSAEQSSSELDGMSASGVPVSDNQKSDPTEYFAKLFDSQQVNNLADFYDKVIDHEGNAAPHFFVDQPKHAYYIKRLIKQYMSEEDPRFLHRWLLDRLKERIPYKRLLSGEFPSEPASSVRDWLGEAQSISEKYAFMLCYVFELKPATENMNSPRAPLDSAEGFLARVGDINAFNGRDVEHVIHKYCLSAGHTYDVAMELMRAFDAAEVDLSEDVTDDSFEEDGFTRHLIMETLLGAEGLEIDLETFRGEIIAWKPAFTKRARTAQRYYFYYKNQVMLHCIQRALQKGRGTKADDEDFRVYESIDKKIDTFLDEHGCTLEVSTERFESLRITINTVFSDEPDNAGEPGSLKKERLKSKLLGKIISEREFFDQLVYQNLAVYAENQSEKTPHAKKLKAKDYNNYGATKDNAYLFQFVQHLPLRNHLRRIEDPESNFHRIAHARDALVLFFFYDYAYRIYWGEKGFSAEDFYFSFKVLMDECCLAQPLFRSLYDYTLINCITELANSDSPIREPHQYFLIFFQLMDRYAQRRQP